MSEDALQVMRLPGDFTRMKSSKMREMAAFLSNLADIAETRENEQAGASGSGWNVSTFPFAPSSQQVSSKLSTRRVRPPLPDSRLVREILRQRDMRAHFFQGTLFGDPAWDMLLDITAAYAERKRVSITSLCIASRVPQTTALRWIAHMTNAGLLKRENDDVDKRRAFVTLTSRAADAVSRYFAAIEPGASAVI